jgi:hypothetical protein
MTRRSRIVREPIEEWLKDRLKGPLLGTGVDGAPTRCWWVAHIHQLKTGERVARVSRRRLKRLWLAGCLWDKHSARHAPFGESPRFLHWRHDRPGRAR